MVPALKTCRKDGLCPQGPGLCLEHPDLVQLLLILVVLEACMTYLLGTSLWQSHKRGQFAIRVLDILRYQLAGEQSLRYAHHIVHNLILEPEWKLIILLDQCPLHMVEPMILRISTQFFSINFDIEFLYPFEFLVHQLRSEERIFVLTFP